MAFCKNCGNKLEDGTKFCPKCGNPTGGTWSNENVTGNDTVWNIAFTAPIDEKIKLEIIKVLMNDLGMDKSYAEERVKFAPCIVAEGLRHDVVETIAHKLQALGVSVSINSYAVTNMSNSQSVNQEQAVNQFEPDTEKSGKLGCWSKILYAIGVLIFLGYLAEKCGGDDTNVDEGNASQATEQVVSDVDQEELDKVAKAGYNDGFNAGFTNSEYSELHEGENEGAVRTHYTYSFDFDKPKNDKGKKCYKIFRENFWKGYKDGVKAR